MMRQVLFLCALWDCLLPRLAAHRKCKAAADRVSYVAPPGLTITRSYRKRNCSYKGKAPFGIRALC